MADERLTQGRHHLLNGRRALRLGFREDGQRYFQAALLRFRSPELRLGEAHALRGLAEAALAMDLVDEAETQVRAALATYQEIPALVEAFQETCSEGSEEDQETRASLESVRSGAREGEVASWALLGEVLSRRGHLEAAEAALESAQNRFGDLQESAAAAEVYGVHGRVAQREERIDDARTWFDRAVQAHHDAANKEGEIVSRLHLAEVVRQLGDIDVAYATLHEALRLARDMDEELLEGRVLCALGEVALEARHDAEAASYFDDALSAARIAGDIERQAQALVGRGTAGGRRGEADAIPTMFEGIKILGEWPGQLGLAPALLRLGNHARRVGEARLALATSEVARRMYLTRDPIGGQGQALRTQVKALAQLGLGETTLCAAFAREKLAGALQPNAVEVAEWYAERAPDEVVDKLRAEPLESLMTTTRTTLEQILEADLQLAALAREDLDDVDKALGLISVMVEELVRDKPRLSVRPVVGRTEEPAVLRKGGPDAPTESASDAAADSEKGDDGEYKSLEDVYGSLYES